MSWSEVKKINSDLSTPLNEGGVKIVKSVQRGFANNGGVTITISQVNPSKCTVLLKDSYVSRANTTAYGGALVNMTDTSIEISSTYDGWSNHQISWQVIEFY